MEFYLQLPNLIVEGNGTTIAHKKSTERVKTEISPDVIETSTAYYEIEDE